MPVILRRFQTLALRVHNRNMIRQRVTTNQNTTSVHPRLPHGAFQNLRQPNCLRHQRVG